AKIIAESAGHSASDQITSRTMESEIGPKRNPYSDSAFSGRALASTSISSICNSISFELSCLALGSAAMDIALQLFDLRP
ncbi:hypothetical protein, partial [Rhizobium sp. LEGMi135b]